MKKIGFSMVCLFAIIAGIMADNDRITTDANELPAQSREFIRKWFGDTAISYIKIDRELTGIDGYDVRLENGVEIDFNKNGEWKEIKAKNTILPENILPEGIVNQIKVLHPGEDIRKIEKDGKKTEVELTNGVELTFNKDGKLIETDY